MEYFSARPFADTPGEASIVVGVGSMWGPAGAYGRFNARSPSWMPSWATLRRMSGDSYGLGYSLKVKREWLDKVGLKMT